MPSALCSTRKTWPRTQDFWPMCFLASVKGEHSPVGSVGLGRSAAAGKESTRRIVVTRAGAHEIAVRFDITPPERLGPGLQVLRQNLTSRAKAPFFFKTLIAGLKACAAQKHFRQKLGFSPHASQKKACMGHPAVSWRPRLRTILLVPFSVRR